MLIYHQTGHNFIWNLQSMQDDGVGAGLIVSPVNVEAERISERIPAEVLSSSWLDPQFYLPNDSKNKLTSYPFFPGNVLEDFTTAGYQSHALAVAEQCLTFQSDIGFRYLVVPTRYFDDLPEDYLDQLSSLFLDPFVESRNKLGLTADLLLTVIAKPIHLADGVSRDELLSWVTGVEEVAGVYLMLDQDSSSKQIKEPNLLVGMLRFIHALRQNGLEVHVGYSGLEGLLYALADPTSGVSGGRMRTSVVSARCAWKHKRRSIAADPIPAFTRPDFSNQLKTARFLLFGSW